MFWMKEEITQKSGTSECVLELFSWVLYDYSSMGTVVAFVKLPEFVLQNEWGLLYSRIELYVFSSSVVCYL